MTPHRRDDNAFTPGPIHPQLNEDEVHVWLAPLCQPRRLIESFRRTLSDDELTRAERFANEDLRGRYVIGRGVLRDVLARYCNANAASLSFEYEPRGKPSLAGVDKKRGLEFSASHSGEWFLCAVTRGRRVGVDIEKIECRESFLKLAERFFAPAEVDAIKDLTPDQQISAFHACWTRKEAYVKAKGAGLALPLDTFEVSLIPGAPPALLRSRIDPQNSARWALFDVAPLTGYAAALAVENPSAKVTCWAWPPC